MENSLRRAEGWVIATLKMSRHRGQVRAKWRAMVRSHIAAATRESIVGFFAHFRVIFSANDES